MNEIYLFLSQKFKKSTFSEFEKISFFGSFWLENLNFPSGLEGRHIFPKNICNLGEEHNSPTSSPLGKLGILS